jgi:hypothetical protein
MNNSCCCRQTEKITRKIGHFSIHFNIGYISKIQKCPVDWKKLLINNDDYN